MVRYEKCGIVTGDLDGDGKVEAIVDFGQYGVFTWDRDNAEP